MVAHTALTSQDSQKSFFAQTCTFKRFQPGTAEPRTSPECGMELCQTCICEQNCSRRASEIYFRNSFTYPPLKFQWPKGWVYNNNADSIISIYPMLSNFDQVGIPPSVQPVLKVQAAKHEPIHLANRRLSASWSDSLESENLREAFDQKRSQEPEI